MARSESTTRRVTHLVGRFEQLVDVKPERDLTSSSHGGREARSHSQPNKVSLTSRGVSSSRRRSASISSSEAGLRFKSAEERLRRRTMQDDCETLWDRCRTDEEFEDDLIEKLELEQLSRQGYEEQRKYFERKIESMRRQLAFREHEEKMEHERADAEACELRRQLSVSESTREADLEKARSESQRQYDLLAGQLRDAESRAKSVLRTAESLEQQLRILKQSMSGPTKMERQATDRELADKMSRLNHELQNWVINTFRKVKIDKPLDMKRRFKGLPILADAVLLRSLYDDFDPASKLFALQSTVIYLVMRIFQGGYFFGLPEGLQTLRVSADAIKSPTAPYNAWRSQTCLFLQRAEGEVRNTIDMETTRQKEQLLEHIPVVLSTLTKAKLSDGQLTGLSKIVDHAIYFSRLLGVQRPVYKCMLPAGENQGGLVFDKELMEDVLDAEDVQARSIKCVTFPAVLKAGDEFGDNMNLRNVVMKAKVLCHAHQSDDQGDELD